MRNRYDSTMHRLWRILPLLCICVVAVLPRIARAQSSSGSGSSAASPNATSVAVLTLASEDADDQATALTGALRSRVRSSQNWALLETPNSLSIFMTALRCPRVPDATCLQKIADALKTDHFVWGTMTKSAGATVTVDLHFYARGKADRSTHESYSDNLKDQNDETLRKIAAALFDRTTGTMSTGVIVVHAGDGDGVVIVDGQKRGQLEHGEATIETLTGDHTVLVRAKGFAQAARKVTVVASQTTRLDIPLTADDAAEPSGPNDKSIGTTRILAWTAVGVGAVAIAVAGTQALKWSDDASYVKDQNLTRYYVGDPCSQQGISQAKDACDHNTDAKRAAAIGWTLAVVGTASIATGIYFLVTDRDQQPGDSHPPAQQARTRLRLLPEFGRNTAGLSAIGNF